MKEFKYKINGKEYNVEIGEVDEETNVANVKVNGEEFQVEMEKPAEPEKKTVVLGKPAAESKGDAGSEQAPQGNVNANNATKAPLPGTITAIEHAVGDEVKAGDTVLVLEAMKMANNIEAEKDGKITAICVKVGQSVMEDDPLFVVE
jgi:biotin carboxyl carrier protein